LESAGEFVGVLWGSGMHRELRIRQEPSPHHFATSASAPAALTKVHSLLKRSNDTAIQSIERRRQRNDQAQNFRFASF
jgi:hypothetical protein